MALPRLLKSALQLQRHWDSIGYRFCFIGAIAVQRWGQPRATKDLDLTLLTGFGGEEVYIDAILKDFQPRIPDAREFALLNRVLLVRDRHGVDIDIALGAMPFEERSIERASRFDLGKKRSIVTCSATDLIVHKAFAGREQDWIDIRGILVRSRSHVDWETVLSELRPLVELKEEPEILDRLQALFDSTTP